MWQETEREPSRGSWTAHEYTFGDTTNPCSGKKDGLRNAAESRTKAFLDDNKLRMGIHAYRCQRLQ